MEGHLLSELKSPIFSSVKAAENSLPLCSIPGKIKIKKCLGCNSHCGDVSQLEFQESKSKILNEKDITVLWIDKSKSFKSVFLILNKLN